MSKLGAFLKVGALASALALSTSALAATFTIPVNYSIKLVDGQDSEYEYNRFNRSITLSEGRHQIVLLFEGNFGNARSARMFQAANPIVVEIPNMPADAEYTFTYKYPRNEDEADVYTRSQKINLIDSKSKAPLTAEQASYYILTSTSGFAILRDYREDLASINRLYAPAKVMDQLRNGTPTVSYADNGVQTVQARAGGYKAPVVAPVAVAASAPAAQAAQAQPGEPQTVQAGDVNMATYNQLVNLYNQADDATKLKFFKYIMAN